jgi:hypothetical protein
LTPPKSKVRSRTKSSWTKLSLFHGEPIEVIHPGDYVFVEPGEYHWHGAAANRFMAHFAMLEVNGEGNNATWDEHVTDEEYDQQPG